MINLSLLSIFGLLIFLTSFIFAIIVSIFGHQKVHRLWTLFNLGNAIWGLGMFFVGIKGSSYENAVFWWKIAHIGGMLLSVCFLHTILVLCSVKRPFILSFYYISDSIFFILLNLMGKMGYKPELMFDSIYFCRAKDFRYVIATFLWFSAILYAFFILFKEYLKSSGLKKNQLKYFIFPVFVAFISGSSHFLPAYGIKIYPFNIFMIAYPIFASYAILKYRLLDVRVAFTRAGLFILVYTIVLGFPFAIATYSKAFLVDFLGIHWWVFPLGLMALLATAGPFMYIYLQKRAEDRLLKEQRKYQSTLKQASIGMTRIRNLDKLLSLIAHIVTKTVKISYVAVYLLNRDTNDYVLHLSRDKGRVSIPKVSSEDTLIRWIKKKRDPIIYEEIKRLYEDTGEETYKNIEERMRLLTASVIIPSFLDNKFMGFFVLGDKMSGQIYTPEDLNVFQILASQAALAIENAQFYEDAKEMQDQISQAEKMATIGTMADGLSHQINNRFYALSLIAGDSIDTIKLTDTSKCTPEIREMINEINHALERIQTNVTQGGEVVKGMLKYSRRGEEGFEALDLDKVVDGTLEMVQFKVKLSEIDIIREYKNIPKIKGNLTQLEEAFFNFIDNANDAISERKTTLNEPGYRGKIIISAKQKDDNMLEIIIQDNGMGVKEDCLKKVFTPFFTTKTSSRKGTGLGLYVIKRIISEIHKGSISFESAYKVGTRFILELPIAK